MAQLRDTYIAKYQVVGAGESTPVPIKTTTAATGAIGDYIDEIIITPSAVTAGNISLFDGATELSLFVTGTLTNLTPINIKAGWRAVNTGGWSMTTGATVTVRVTGRF